MAAGQNATRWPKATASDRLICTSISNVRTSLPSSASLTAYVKTGSCTSLDQEISSSCSTLNLGGENDCSVETKCSVEKSDLIIFLPPAKPKENSEVTTAPPPDPKTHLFDDTTEAADETMFSTHNNKYVFNATSRLDVADMQQKLCVQKELLMSSFKSPPHLPADFSKEIIASPTYKSGCLQLKVKDRLQKVRRAAKRFLHQNLVKRQQPRLQRCELCLTGLPDKTSQLILTITKHSSGGENHYVYFPAFLDTQVILSKCLLPINSREEVTVTVYAVACQNDGDLKEFNKVCASSRCKVQADKTLITAFMELQQHNPSSALAGQMHNRSMSSCTTQLTHTHPSTYKFEATPKPIATDFTELLILQMADPFQEYITLSSSTCEQPASTNVSLVGGKYYGASSYRLTREESSGVFAVHSASLPVFFKAYVDKTEKAELCKKAAAIAKQAQDEKSPPVSQLFLSKPPGFDIEDFLKTCHSKHAESFRNDFSIEPKTPTKTHISVKQASKAADGLHFVVHNSSKLSLQYPVSSGDDCDRIQVPSLTIFNMNTRLYFADLWDYYGKSHVMLVLCTKGSSAEKFCKQNLCKLDPYNNPFLYRKRVLFPEACVQVFAAQNLNVEILYVDSEDIKQHTLFCSGNLFFSKVHSE